jgi:TonB family protein
VLLRKKHRKHSGFNGAKELADDTFRVPMLEFADSNFRIYLPRQVTLLAICMMATVATAKASQRPTRVALLDLGSSQTARRAIERISQAFAGSAEFQIPDHEQARAAAKGSRYQGSLNLTVEEARDIGAAIDCDFFIVGDSQTLRRSPSTGAAYYESYASIFLVSARTGRLILWEQPLTRADSAGEAQESLLQLLSSGECHQRYVVAMQRAMEDERAERIAAVETPARVIEGMSEDRSDDSDKEVRAPRPYLRLIPTYPESAARAELEAVVDVLVDIDARGEVGRVEIARWAGYGLDQSVIDTVKQMHFFPAMRDGHAIPMRVLLRYNFRKPVQNRSR